MSTRKQLLLTVLAIFAIALAIRLWGIAFGLPFAYHVDESRYIHSAVGILQTGDLNPGWFYQPSLYTYLITGALGLYFVAAWLAGVYSSRADLFRPPYHFDGLLPDATPFLLARIITALIGALNVVAVFLMAQKWWSRLAGVTAAGFLTFSLLHQRSSHFIATDIPLTLAITGALYGAVQVATTGQRRYYVWTGVLVGVTIGFKYSGYVIVAPVVVAHLVAWRKGNVTLIDPKLLLAGLLAGGVAFLSTPYSVLDFEAFVTDILYEYEHHRVTGHVGAEGNSGAFFVNYLLNGPERWITIAGVAGLVIGCVQRRVESVLLLLFLVVYFVSMATNLVRFSRFLVPLMPILALGSGYLAHVVRAWVMARFNRPKRTATALVGVAVAICLIEPVVATARMNHLLTQTDVRTVALDWIVENVPAGSHLAREAYTPALESAGLQVEYIGRLAQRPPDYFRENGIEYVVFSQARYQQPLRDPARNPDLVAGYEALWAEFEPVVTLTGPYVGQPDYDILVYRVTP